MSTFRVAPGRSLRMPPTRLKKIVVAKGVIRVGEPGRLIPPGELLPDDYVAWAAEKIEGGTGRTLLANLLADGVIVEES